MTDTFKVTARLAMLKPPHGPHQTQPPPPAIRQHQPPVLTPEDLQAREAVCRSCDQFWPEQTFCMHPLCKCPKAQPWHPWQNLRRCPARKW